MYPPYSMSDEEFREIAKNLSDFTFSLARRETKAFILAAKAVGIGSVSGVVICSLAAIGQSYAVGYYTAKTMYGIWWKLSPLLGAGVPLALYLISLLIFNGSLFVGKVYEATFSETARKLFEKIFMGFLVLLVVAAIIGLPIFAAYDSTSKSNMLIEEQELTDLKATSQAASNQAKALAEVSASGKTLLSQFEQMQLALEKSHNELAQTLKTVDSRIVDADRAAAQVAELTIRQHQIELRMAELQRVLDGGQPITRKDLDSSGKTGLIVGAVIGFGTSLAAAIAYSWVGRLLRRRRVRRNGMSNLPVDSDAV